MPLIWRRNTRDDDLSKGTRAKKFVVRISGRGSNGLHFKPKINARKPRGS